MESSTFDFNNSSANLEIFRQKANVVFSEIKILAQNTSVLMSESFLLSAQETSFVFGETFFGLENSFGTSIGIMGESASAFWLGLGEGFAATWIGISEGTAAFFDRTNAGFIEFWMGLDMGFVNLWASVNETTGAFATQMNADFNGLWTGIDTGFIDLWSAVDSNTLAFCTQMNADFAGLWMGLDTGFNDLWSGINEGTDSLHTLLNENNKQSWNSMKEGYTSLWSLIDERFRSLWGNVTIGNTALWSATDKDSSNSVSNVSRGFSTMRSNVSGENKKLWEETEKGSEALLTGLNEDFKGFWSAIPEGMKGMAKDICDILNTLLRWLVSPINSIIKGFNKIPFVNIPELNPTISPPKFARGGFPAQGQMFIAREAGPEPVGTIGGRTAVANNDQIVESVSSGVYKAVRSALNGGSQSSTIQVFVGNEQLDEYIASSQRRRSLQTNGIYA